LATIKKQKILGLFGRCAAGRMVAHRGQDALAGRLLEETCIKQNNAPGQLTVNAVRQPGMKSTTVAQLMADLGIIKTQNRPQASNDNPYSVAQLKTLKY